MYSDRIVRFIRLLVLVFAVAALNGCAGAGWFGGDPLRVSVAGLEPLDSQGSNVRFNLKVHLLNPGSSALNYKGISVALEVNGKPLISGASPVVGSVPPFGDAVISVPVSIVAAPGEMQKIFGFADRSQYGQIEYILRGHLAGSGITGGKDLVGEGSLPVPFPYIGADS